MEASDDIAIVPYESAQLPALLDISERAFAPNFAGMRAALPDYVFDSFYRDGWRSRQRRDVSALCEETPDVSVRVAVGAGAGPVVPLGFVGIRLHPQDLMGEIVIIAVDPAEQGRAVGAALTRHALDAMRAAGMAFAMAETGMDEGHAGSRRFYERQGFALWPVARYVRSLAE